MTAVADGTTLEHFGARLRSGDLRDLSAELGEHRCEWTTRIVAPLDEFNPYTVELDEAPLVHPNGVLRTHLLQTRTSPPCVDATCLTIDSPRPVPPVALARAGSTR